MRWELSEEQADYRAVLADWLTEHCHPDVLRPWLEAGDHATFTDRFVADGWFGVGSPEALGGQGGGLVELALTAEELGRRAAPSAAWTGSMLALPALRSEPGEAEALLEGVVTVLASPADAVPGTPVAVQLEGREVTGTVPTVIGADRARRLVVPVGSAAVLLDVEQSGVEVRPRGLTDRTRTVADVVLDRAACTPLTVDDDVLAETALRGAVLVAADALGSTGRMLDLTVEYVAQRRQFGVAIGSFPAVKHAAAEMLVTVEAARSIVYLAAASVEAGHPDAPLHAAAAKAQATAGAAVAADTALTLHGAIGYTWEHELQLHYKRAKLDEPLCGPPAVWNERLADALALAVPARG